MALLVQYEVDIMSECSYVWGDFSDHVEYRLRVVSRAYCLHDCRSPRVSGGRVMIHCPWDRGLRGKPYSILLSFELELGFPVRDSSMTTGRRRGTVDRRKSRMVGRSSRSRWWHTSVCLDSVDRRRNASRTIGECRWLSSSSFAGRWPTICLGCCRRRP